MELLIQGKNLELSERVRQYVERKIGSLDRYLDHITEAKVEITRERTRSLGTQLVVQVTLDCDGTIIRGEERAREIYAAINAVTSVLDRQIEHFKGRHYRKGRESLADREQVIPDEERLTDKVVRTKRFPVKPMTLEEAIEQMELLGHSFFLFLDDATEQFSVLYRRRDGGYGLIQPESP